MKRYVFNGFTFPRKIYRGHKMCILFHAIFQKQISEKNKAKRYCRDNYFHSVNIQQTSQLKFDPALNAKFSRLCKFWSRLNSVGHKLACDVYLIKT